MASQHTDGEEYRFYAGAVVAVLILVPFYLAVVIWWWS
jgi:hypothetical protein